MAKIKKNRPNSKPGIEVQSLSNKETKCNKNDNKFKETKKGQGLGETI